MQEIFEENGTKTFNPKEIWEILLKILSEMIKTGMTEEELQSARPYLQIMMDKYPKSTDAFFKSQGRLGRQILSMLDKPSEYLRYPVEENMFGVMLSAGALLKSPEEIERYGKKIATIIAQAD